MAKETAKQCATCHWWKVRSKYANMRRYAGLTKGKCHLGPPMNWRDTEPDDYCGAWMMDNKAPKPPKKPCPACDGNGSYYIDPEGIKFPIHTHHHEDMREETCETCEGTGEVETK